MRTFKGIPEDRLKELASWKGQPYREEAYALSEYLVALREELDASLYVRVTAADFNGESFDGSPFSSIPQWLQAALDSKEITIEPDNRDYAIWRVSTSKGDVIAEPGDFIVSNSSGLSVYTESKYAPRD